MKVYNNPPLEAHNLSDKDKMLYAIKTVFKNNPSLASNLTRKVDESGAYEPDDHEELWTSSDNVLSVHKNNNSSNFPPNNPTGKILKLLIKNIYYIF